MFQRGIDDSLMEFQRVLQLAKNNLNDPDLQEELNIRLGTLLHWMMVYWERVKQSFSDISQETETLFSAFGYANNQMKHEVTLTKFVYRSGGFSFPISFPLTIPEIRFSWHLDSNHSAKFENQYTNFKKYLDNKEVMETVSSAIGILKEYKLS